MLIMVLVMFPPAGPYKWFRSLKSWNKIQKSKMTGLKVSNFGKSNG